MQYLKGAQCPVCAWRETCAKRFRYESMEGKLMCPDFTYDIRFEKKANPDQQKPETTKP